MRRAKRQRSASTSWHVRSRERHRRRISSVTNCHDPVLLPHPIRGYLPRVYGEIARDVSVKKCDGRRGQATPREMDDKRQGQRMWVVNWVHGTLRSRGKHSVSMLEAVRVQSVYTVTDANSHPSLHNRKPNVRAWSGHNSGNIRTDEVNCSSASQPDFVQSTLCSDRIYNSLHPFLYSPNYDHFANTGFFAWDHSP